MGRKPSFTSFLSKTPPCKNADDRLSLLEPCFVTLWSQAVRTEWNHFRLNLELALRQQIAGKRTDFQASAIKAANFFGFALKKRPFFR